MKKKLFAAVLMLVIAVVALSTATLAWFDGSETVYVKTINSKVTTTAGLLIHPRTGSGEALDTTAPALDSTLWSDNVDFALTLATANLVMTDLTAASETSVGSAGTNEFHRKVRGTSYGTYNQDYLRLEFWVYASTGLDLPIYLSEVTTGGAAGTNFAAVASGRDFEGAQSAKIGYTTRIAFYSAASTAALAQDAICYAKNETVAPPAGPLDPTAGVGVSAPSAITARTNDLAALVAAHGGAAGTGSLFTLSSATGVGIPQHVVIYVWIEGTDIYTTNTIAGANITLNLAFSARAI